LSAPKVSIIITVYNLEGILSNCFESCVNQSYQDIEIVVINDGSTDNSGKIIDEFKAFDKRIIAINKTNEGLCLARKAGIEIAKGDYIFFFDGDDTIPLNTIETLYNLAQLHTADIVSGNFRLFQNESLIEERTYSSFGIGSGIEFLEFILINHLHYLCGKLIKRSLYIINDIEIKKEAIIGEDQIQMYQLCMFADKVATTDTVVYNYIFNGSSMTQKRVPNETFTTLQELYAHALYELQQKFPYNDLIRQQINLRILAALNLALIQSGHYVQNKVQSSMIMSKTLKNALFSARSRLWNHESAQPIVRLYLSSKPNGEKARRPVFIKILHLFKINRLVSWLCKTTFYKMMKQYNLLAKCLISLAYPGFGYCMRSRKLV
jgi:glycosyltransferase involved in cell wall biosynthesis